MSGSDDTTAGAVQLSFIAGDSQADESRHQLSDACAAAMLHNTAAAAIQAAIEPTQRCRITALAMQFLDAGRLGPLTAAGRVVWRQGDTACLEATLRDGDGVLVAQATGTAVVNGAIPCPRRAQRPR